ncbi:meiosis arrest female protein 1-like [Melia azedarach]|nr:meiosis arrest female protein 1-like [Melia azedarach]
MYWVTNNPPPAHLFLISGDRDFASILHRLRMNNYNILLASPASAPNVLCSAASIMWNWESLLRGENLTGKHFNQPPDGPYGSWYGHYKVPLIDPFSVAEQAASSRTEEVPEPASDCKVRPVPKPVIRQIRHILNSYPEGIAITELRAELSKSAVTIDKDLYGYKKFSRFLLSMPNILKLRPEADGQFCVCGVRPKAPEPFETSVDTSDRQFCKNGDQELSLSLKLNGDQRFKDRDAEGESILPLSPEAQKSPVSSKKAVNTDVEEHLNKVKQPCPIDKQVIKPVVAQEYSMSEVGFLKKIWLRWFGGKTEGSEIKSEKISEICSDSGDISDLSQKKPEKSLTHGDCEKLKLGKNKMRSSSQDAAPVESVQENKIVTNAKACGDKSATSSGVLTRIVNWCKFQRRRPETDTQRDQSNERLNQINSNSQKHEVFLKDSFWSDMESFMDSPRGSVIVSQSRTRKQMAQCLQKEGPLALRELSDHDLLDLVDVLISEKKWVEEYPSQDSPFKLTRLVGKRSSLGQSAAANGLRSIFMDTLSKSNSLKIPDHDGEKKSPSIPHFGVSGSVIHRKSSDRSRNDILADCQKLVNDILKEYPEGYNLGSFRKLFLERYGYHLDLQKLGYQKLATLLQIMPGVKIESTYILPATKVPDSVVPGTSLPEFQETNADQPSANSDGELSETSKKNDDSDSQWEELGPVSNSDGNEVQSGLKSRATKDTMTEMYPEYEPSVSDDELSDSEGESSPKTRSEEQVKSQINDVDSSLLQILDSWYSSKEGDDNKSKNVDGMVDCSNDGAKPSEVATNSEPSLGNFIRKQRPEKKYAFVLDSDDNDKDKLIDGILGSLKKSGESKMQG